MPAKKLYVIAGEASGDLHGATLIEYIQTLVSDPLEIYGVGGDKIKATGAKNFIDIAHFHVTGLTHIAKNLPKFLKAFKQILSDIERVKPDLVVLIDNPGFNMRLGKKLYEKGIPAVYYITPQVWAWGSGRIEKIRTYFKKVFVVFEFEETLFKKNNVPVSFVGHPLKDLIQNVIPQPKDKNEIRLAILPGSRDEEVYHLLPLFLKASKLISKKIENCRSYVIQSPTLPKKIYEDIFEKTGIRPTLIDHDKYAWIKSSDLALVCSGTATLETAILGTPLIISYKGTWISFEYARRVIKIPYIGLPNIILEDKRIPELLQHDATPNSLSQVGIQILEDKEMNKKIRMDLKKVSEKLGPGGANKRAAEEIFKVLEDTSLVRSR